MKVTTIQDIQQACKYLNTNQQLKLWTWWFNYTDQGAEYYIEQVFGDKLREIDARLDKIGNKIKEWNIELEKNNNQL